MSDDTKRERIVAAFDGAVSIHDAARRAGVSFNTARKHAPESFLQSRGVAVKPVTRVVPIAAIRLDGGTQLRAMDGIVREDTVEEYAESYTKGEDIPPPTLFHVEGEIDYWPGDGHHRVVAAGRAGLSSLECVIRPGGQADAILFAAGANATHGLRRTNADKRRAVVTLMTDARWQGLSNREIADLCSVTHAMTNAVRKELDGGSAHVPGPSGTPMTNGEARKVEGASTKPTVTAPPENAGEWREVVTSGPDHAPEASEPTDAEYLLTLPAREKLSPEVRDRFDCMALLFRWLSPLRRQYADDSRSLVTKAVKMARGHQGPLVKLHYRYLSMNDPSRWEACESCRGTGADDLLGKCTPCRGNGYHDGGRDHA